MYLEIIPDMKVSSYFIRILLNIAKVFMETQKVLNSSMLLKKTSNIPSIGVMYVQRVDWYTAKTFKNSAIFIWVIQNLDVWS